MTKMDVIIYPETVSKTEKQREEAQKPKTEQDARLLAFVDYLEGKGLIPSARKLGIMLAENAALVSKVRQGVQSFQQRDIDKLVSEYGLNPNWLQTGQGPMATDSTYQTPESPPQAVDEHLEAYKRLAETRIAYLDKKAELLQARLDFLKKFGYDPGEDFGKDGRE